MGSSSSVPFLWHRDSAPEVTGLSSSVCQRACVVSWPCLGCQTPTQTLTPPHHQNREKIWWKTHGWDKDREINHQLLSWAKPPYLLPINNCVRWWETETNPKRPFTSTSPSSQGQLHSWFFYMPPEQYKGMRNWGCIE